MILKGEIVNNPFESAMQQLSNAAKFIKDKKINNLLEKLQNPEKIIQVWIPVVLDNGETKIFEGYRVQYSSERGPYKGGIRFHPNVSMDEVKALSFWMAIKCGVAGIFMGGGKGGVMVDPHKLSEGELERLSRGYARAIASNIGAYVDVPAPDVNTNPKIMKWMVEEYREIQNSKCKIKEHEIFATFTGKPIDFGGSEGRTEATGRGGVYVLQALLAKLSSKLNGKNINNLTVAVMGFGNVGYYIAKLLADEGFKIVAVSDSKGGITTLKLPITNYPACSCLPPDSALAQPMRAGRQQPMAGRQLPKKTQISNSKNKNIEPEAIDIEQTLKCKKEKGSVAGCYCLGSVCDISYKEKFREISNEELLELPVDILVPAALENVINEKNADKVKAKIILEMANGPTTPEADKILFKKGITVVPDVLSNSGGVTVSCFEWEQNLKGQHWSEKKVNTKLKEKMEEATSSVWETAEKNKTDLRTGAFILALNRIMESRNK